LNYFTTDQGTLLRDKRVIQCDLDPRRLGSTVPVDAGVVGDATAVASTITEWLQAADHRPSSFASDELQQRLVDFDPSALFDDLSTSASIDPRTATLALDRLLPDDRSVVVDAGRFMLNALTLPVPDPESLITSHGFGSIGLGTSTAIGVGIARPNRPTVLCVGDGGFMMGGVGEFHTAVENNIDLIVILYNDGSYGAEHIQLWRKEMDTKASLHHWPEFGPVLTSLGAVAVKVSSIADLEAASTAIENRSPGQPVVIELSLDPDVVSSIMGH
jgi:acetolactate synthase I/II/III large subunit